MLQITVLKKWEDYPQNEGGKISANHLSDKRLIFKIYKQLNLAQEQNKLKMGNGSEHKFFQRQYTWWPTGTRKGAQHTSD